MGPHILQPLKSQGVLAMEDSAMLVKAKFTAKPGEQFVIRREAYQRIKQAFDEAGIHFAHRQVTVFVPPGSGRRRPWPPRRVPLAAGPGAKPEARPRRRPPPSPVGHVEQAMPLLAKPRFARTARYGTAGAASRSKYVSEIQRRYESYSSLIALN